MDDAVKEHDEAYEAAMRQVVSTYKDWTDEQLLIAQKMNRRLYAERGPTHYLTAALMYIGERLEKSNTP